MIRIIKILLVVTQLGQLIWFVVWMELGLDIILGFVCN